jgi:DNA-damage-inducible protein D
LKLTHTERELSGSLYQRGVDDKGFAIIRSKGDAALFGGYTTLDMKRKLGVSGSRPLADFLPTVTIKAKDLAAEITNYTVRTTSISGMDAIGRRHVNNNENVRNALTASGIHPERLAAAEDIKKVERRLKSEEKSLPLGAISIPRLAPPAAPKKAG